MDTPAAVQANSPGWAGSIAWSLVSMLQLVSSILYWVFWLATIRIPTLLFTMFSTTWTVTMNATTLMLILAAFISLVTLVFRYRVLNTYSRLPPEPQRKEPEIDLFPDTHDEGPKAGLSSYLDEFLSAIKIFGYLERPVFHELTRSMQTRKLISGETFDLEEEKGFCIVVDGLVEIFVKSGRNSAMHEDPCTDEDDSISGQQRYQLLTEVRNGAPMSSLFSIMSLFTEDISLRQTDDEYSTPPASARSPQTSMKSAMGHDPPQKLSDIVSLPASPSLDATPSSPHLLAGQSVSFGSPTTSGTIPPINLNDTQPPLSRPQSLNRNASSSAHPDIIARATVDTTIAIIPASAFRRLIKIYPKSTTHIVHVILSRFQRVTLTQAFSYLGLTGEVLQAEKRMLQYTTCQLPNVLRGDALQRLKDKFDKEKERAGAEADEAKGIALHNAASGRARRSSVSLLKEATARQSMAKRAPVSMVAPSSATTRDRRSRHQPSPGDLIGDFELARTVMSRPSMRTDDSLLMQGSPRMSPLSQKLPDPLGSQNHARVWTNPSDEWGEDNQFRVCVAECILKILGFGASGVTSSRDAESAEVSPRLLSLDHRRQKTVLGSNNNAFGLIGPYEGSVDAETESMVSDATGYATVPTPQVLSHDLKDDVEIVFFPKGSVLVDQGERSPGLYYVIQGFLDIGCSSKELLNDNNLISQAKAPVVGNTSGTNDDTPGLGSDRNGYRDKAAKVVPNQKQRRSVALIKPGGIAGYVSTVSSSRSFVDVVAKTDVYVGFLPRASLERIVDRYPIALLVMAKRLTHTLPRLLLHIDFALEWVQVNAGQVIFHDKDESDAIYIVLNGRLRLVEEKKEGGVSMKAEFGQGESVGELEVLTESVRSGTLHAIRDTELVKFPRTLFNSLALEHPNITIRISKIIASRMRSLIDDPSKLQGTDAGLGISSKESFNFNLRTVAVLPVTAGIPIVEFGNRLLNALSQVGPSNGATSLDQAAILNHLGKHAFSRIGKLRLSQYLADLEEKYGLVVYVADTNFNSPWTQTCITQADCILLVGLSEGSPEIGEYERFMLGMKSTARKTLVLIHADRYPSPGLSRSWLRNRMWINGGHHHVQMPFTSGNLPVHSTTRRLGAALKERVQTLQAEFLKYTSRKGHTALYSPETPFKGDFYRLARKLCGKSVGLVLGGGGARGISQIGIIRAMEEEGIPIDLVGGTSIGAFIGALYARHADVVTIYGLAKKFSGRMASMWRLALDLTYPSASYTTGHEINRGIFKTFGDAQIEDFWLEYYCNTTNISKSRPEFHNSGYAWRYVRASMSLAGLLPPLCDEGDMLVDGGYIDNLTVSHMKRLGADIIFAVDVGSVVDDTPQTYGDSLSGLWSVFNRWNPFSPHANPPTLAEIQGRLAYVSSVDALERAKTMPGCIYMRPPIENYATLDFAKFDELYELGYNYSKKFFAKLRESGELRLAQTTEAKKALRRTMGPRRASI